MVKKSAAGGGEGNAARATLEQRCADLQFKVPDLSAQRWLCGMEPPLGSIGQAALLGNSYEIA
jgi:hypothetical protein